MVSNEFLLGMLFGFISSILGSLIMWLVVGNWIVKRRIEKEITAFKEGKYDDVLRAVVVGALNVILTDKELAKKTIDYLNGKSTQFAKWASDKFLSYLKNAAGDYGVDIDNSGGGGGNWGKIAEKVLDKIF
jgi:hypothetical protein